MKKLVLLGIIVALILVAILCFAKGYGLYELLASLKNHPTVPEASRNNLSIEMIGTFFGGLALLAIATTVILRIKKGSQFHTDS